MERIKQVFAGQRLTWDAIVSMIAGFGLLVLLIAAIALDTFP